MKEREEKEKATVEEDPEPVPELVLKAGPPTATGPQRLGGNKVIAEGDAHIVAIPSSLAERYLGVAAVQRTANGRVFIYSVEAHRS